MRAVLVGLLSCELLSTPAARCIAFVLKHTPCNTNQHDRLQSVLEGTRAISGGRDFTGAERHLSHRNADSVRSMRIRTETLYG